MSGFEILKAGTLTTVQDKGRFSFMHLGVTNSGFMDEYASNACNKLLGNKLNTNLLEIVFAPIVIKSYANTSLAITGASCDFFINNIKKNTWQSYKIKKGDEIKITKINEGQRVYLGVRNGFNIKKELGSVATSIKEGFGGLDGKKLKNSDFLPLDENKDFIKRRWKKQFIPKYEKYLTLRVILSYQSNDFEQEQIDKFFSNKYTISADFNSMACKLNGEAIKCNISSLVSEAIAYGSVQIPKDGQAIILLKERQTIGGYPKIATVLNIDCYKLAQMKAKGAIKFKQISIEEARNKAIAFEKAFY